MNIIPRLRLSYAKKMNLIFLRCLLRDSLIGGSEIGEFEEKFAKYIKTRYAIAVGSGRIGMYLILKAFNFKEGSEIILQPYTCNILPKLLVLMGLKPVFVDIDEDTLNINPRLIEKKITKNTKAIIATHIDGFPCDMDTILKIAKKHNLKVIEDSADSLGACYKTKKTGSLGDAAFFSFNLGKHINTFGGGMITTNDNLLAEKIKEDIKSFKNQGKNKLFKSLIKANIIRVFTNTAIFSLIVYPVILLTSVINKDPVTKLFEEDPVLNEIPTKYFKKYSNYQAILGLNQLENFEDSLKKRVNNAEIIRKGINKRYIQKSLLDTQPSYLNFIIKTKNREKIKKRLLNKGVDVQESWMKKCSELNLPMYVKCDCPISDKLTKEIIYIPVHSNLKDKQVDYIADIIKKVLK